MILPALLVCQLGYLATTPSLNFLKNEGDGRTGIFSLLVQAQAGVLLPVTRKRRFGFFAGQRQGQRDTMVLGTSHNYGRPKFRHRLGFAALCSFHPTDDAYSTN